MSDSFNRRLKSVSPAYNYMPNAAIAVHMHRANWASASICRGKRWIANKWKWNHIRLRTLFGCVWAKKYSNSSNKIPVYFMSRVRDLRLWMQREMRFIIINHWKCQALCGFVAPNNQFRGWNMVRIMELCGTQRKQFLYHWFTFALRENESNTYHYEGRCKQMNIPKIVQHTQKKNGKENFKELHSAEAFGIMATLAR